MGERRGGGVVVNFWDFVELVEFGPPSMKQLKPSRPPSKNQRFYCLSLLCISQPAGPAKPVRSHINIIIIPSVCTLYTLRTLSTTYLLFFTIYTTNQGTSFPPYFLFWRAPRRGGWVVSFVSRVSIISIFVDL